MAHDDNFNEKQEPAKVPQSLQLALRLVPEKLTPVMLEYWKAMSGLVLRQANLLSELQSHAAPASEPEADIVQSAPAAEVKSLAVIGGGLAGLMSAFHAKKEKPDLAITVYEKASEASYAAEKDDSKRASLSASPARTMRLTPSTPGLSQWRAQETMQVIRTLQEDISAHPEDYPEHIRRRTLLQPQVSILTAPAPDAEGNKDKKHLERIEALTKMDVVHSEVTGAELKEMFPGLFNTLPDNALAMIEGAANNGPNNIAGVMDVEGIMGALHAYLKKRGVNFHYNAQVASIDDTAQGAQIVLTSGSTTTADHAIVAPGQWIEQVKNGKGESLTQAKGIKVRYDNALVMRIDLKALGVDTSAGIPFMKGPTAPGAEGACYSYYPDGTQGVAKYVPASAIQSFKTLDALHAPLSDDAMKARQETALDAAAARFGLDKEALRAHTQFSSCIYTSPEKDEKVLVTPISDHVTLIGLDSSGMARTSGGFGHIAANRALGLEEPYADAYKANNLAAHHELVGAPLTVATKDCTVEQCTPAQLAASQQRGVA